MTDEQTNKTDTSGTEPVRPVEETTTPTPTTPLIDVANAVAERIEKANVETAKLQQLQIDIEARKALGGEGGGQQQLNLISEADKKIKDAAEFFKGTSLETAILGNVKK